jgi:hypothetical protein
MTAKSQLKGQAWLPQKFSPNLEVFGKKSNTEREQIISYDKGSMKTWQSPFEVSC